MHAPMRTTTEIAVRLTGSDDPDVTSRVTRRLENWGNVGLLTPEGERSTGRGRARRYDEHEQIKASVLLLAFTYQSPKGVLELISRLFDDLRGATSGKRGSGARRLAGEKKTLEDMATLLQLAREGKKQVHLILEPTVPEVPPQAHLVAGLRILDNRDSALLVNVTRAIKRIL